MSRPVQEEAEAISLTSGDPDKRGMVATSGGNDTARNDSSPGPGERKDDSASVGGSSSSSQGTAEETGIQPLAAAVSQSASGRGESPPASASTQKSSVSAASIRAGIGGSGRLNQVTTPLPTVAAKQQSVSVDQQMPATQALAVLANVSIYIMYYVIPLIDFLCMTNVITSFFLLPGVVPFHRLCVWQFREG